jgi:hypothetical protein
MISEDISDILCESDHCKNLKLISPIYVIISGIELLKNLKTQMEQKFEFEFAKYNVLWFYIHTVSELNTGFFVGGGGFLKYYACLLLNALHRMRKLVLEKREE